jgi:hypothetical protein
VPSFPSAKEERKHIRKHFGELNEFGVSCADEYLALAYAFSEAEDWPMGLQECQRTCDHKFGRFVDEFGWFAVVREDRSELLTFHVLHPLGAFGIPVKRTHPYATNSEYFDLDCICQARP